MISNTRNKDNVLVVCHDAGGAEIVSAYIKTNQKRHNYFYCISGPAKKIFKRKGLNRNLIKNGNLISLLTKKNINMVLAGTSLGNSDWKDLIRAANHKKIKTVVYIDHWVYYRGRFGYPSMGWRNNLPKEIWVGDKYAFELARKYFTNVIIRLVPNQYTREILNKYKKYSILQKNKKKTTLFLSEPYFVNVRGKRLKLEGFEILETVLNCLYKTGDKNEIIIAFHPSESRNKYDDLFKKYSGKLNIKKSNKYILKELARAKIVIGVETMMLAIACMCGKRTISFFPNSRWECPLPFKEIKNIRSIFELKEYLKSST